MKYYNLNTDISEMKNLSDVAYDKILNKIIYLDYKPGQLLSEKKVAMELKMSTAPIREAFQKLMTEQLVTIYPRRGIIVAPIELNKIIEMFEVRLALESYIGTVLPQRINENQIKTLEEILIKMRKISKESPSIDNYKKFLEYEKTFHFIIYEATNNKEIVEIQRRYFNFAHRLLWIYKDDSILMDSICNEFQSIIEGLKKKDSIRVKEIFELHVRNSFEFIKKKF